MNNINILRFPEMGWTGAAFMSALLLAGCGPGDGIQRVPATGEVTYGGQPVLEGQIRFIPQAGTTGPVTVEKVVEGRYETETSGGVPVGTHRVEIRAYDPKVPPPQGPGMPPRPQLLPAKYNAQSVLELTVDSDESRLAHDFHLEP